MTYKFFKLYTFLTLLVYCSLYALNCQAENNSSHLYHPIDNWQVDGTNGNLYVSGSLTESPCRLAMTSEYQSIDLGNIETANLKKVGDIGRPTAFQIELQDCIEVNTVLNNSRTGMSAWSLSQPAVKIRFIAPTISWMPDFAKAIGAEGLGLAITGMDGALLPLNLASNPIVLPPGQTTLTYYVSPVRTAAKLLPNAYSAVISFQMIYE
ncbi:type 1 fimbrial protein [Providencia rustigianii]|uniref:fimbrial protein n=1 Tax=Providencia rustigianii TaxID=158850 RepID=UPI000F6C17BB|nr:fimbrial protein [Providencia rustigianii]MTC61463.1 type 1 fimbrial protein [Providencia rustigianii]VEH56755.1 Fimbria A protein precursor [Providencia rustigianii]